MVVVRLMDILANGTFPYLIPKDQASKETSFVIHLLFTNGETKGHGGSLDVKHERQARQKPMWNTEIIYGSVLPRTPMLFVIVPLHCHSQMSLSLKLKSLFLLFCFCLFCVHGIYMMPLSA